LISTRLRSKGKEVSPKVKNREPEVGFGDQQMCQLGQSEYQLLEQLEF